MIDQKTARRLVETIRKYSYIDIIIKGSPDPDAMASSYALKIISTSLGTKADIHSLEKITFHQNIQFSKKLKLPIRNHHPKVHQKKSRGYAILDHQSTLVDKISGTVPCVIHIDHHEKLDEENPVDFRIRDTESGSTCTIMTFLFRQLEGSLGISSGIKRRLATALYFGILTDTTNFKYAGDTDREAQKFLSPFVDFYLIETLSRMPYRKEMFKIIRKATDRCKVQGDWAIVGLGFIERKNRDVLPMIADDLLQKKEVPHTAVFALITEKDHLVLEASFRTRKEEFNLNRMIKHITKSGGGRNYKGAFQVSMDFFRYCEDKEHLWEMVYDTTLCAIDQHGGEHAPGIFGKISNILKKNLFKIFQK